MWKHCIVCSSNLGSNEDLEEFQVGHRLASDAQRGRLWVVCPKCERWNLVPIEQRWEAVEALERAYRDSQARYSTQEVGLTRLGRDLEIVRIGDPLPNEFAAWRWGSRFGRRHRRLKSNVNRGKLFQLESGTAWAAGIALAPLLPVLAPVAVVAGALAGPFLLLARLDQQWAVRAGGHHVGRLQLQNGGITQSELSPGWSIHLNIPGLVERENYTGLTHWTEFNGDEAVRLARRAFPLLNRRTPKFGTISDAVNEISALGDVEGFLTHAAGLKPRWVAFQHYPKPILLAMEMALFQDEERRAMEGEMERLAEAWREAERIAEISDNLLEPKGWKAFRTRAKAARAEPPSSP